MANASRLISELKSWQSESYTPPADNGPYKSSVEKNYLFPFLVWWCRPGFIVSKGRKKPFQPFLKSITNEKPKKKENQQSL